MKKIGIVLLSLVLTFGFLSEARALAPTVSKDFKNAASEESLAGYTINDKNIYLSAFTVVDTDYVCSGVIGQEEYPFLETASIFQICSSSESDTSEIEVIYLDSNWDKQTIELELDGQTVTDGTTAIRVLSARIINFANSDEEPIGVISIIVNSSPVTAGVPDSADSVLCNIMDGEGMSHSLIYSTARNESMVITGISSSSFDAGENNLEIVVREYGKNVNIIEQLPFEESSSLNLSMNKRLGEKTDFFQYIKSSATAQELYIKIESYLKKIN